MNRLRSILDSGRVLVVSARELVASSKAGKSFCAIACMYQGSRLNSVIKDDAKFRPAPPSVLDNCLAAAPAAPS